MTLKKKKKGSLIYGNYGFYKVQRNFVNMVSYKTNLIFLEKLTISLRVKASNKF